MKKAAAQEWLTRKLELENELRIAEAAMTHLPNGTSQQFEAIEAKRQLESFEARYGPIREIEAPRRREYEQLKRDHEDKDKVAKEVVARYYRAKSKVDQLKQKLEAIAPPEYDDGFKSSDAHAAIRDSVAPWVEKIKAALSTLDKLANKRRELRNILKATKPSAVCLDEQSLIGADIAEHHAFKSTQRDASETAETIADLIQQVDRAVDRKNTELEEMRADFVRALRASVNHHATAASQETVRQLTQIINTDTFYADNLGRACSDLIQETGANAGDVFGPSYAPSLRISPLHGHVRLKVLIEEYIKGVA